jgi:RNA polymerase sigma factor (sigma-70 family)
LRPPQWLLNRHRDETQAAIRFVPEDALDEFQQRLVGLLPRLRRLARALTRHGADADDLVQTTLERGLARRAQWRAGTRLDAWMFTIMKHAWIDETRAAARRGLGDPAAIDEVPDPQAPSLDARLSADAVRRAISRLPQDQRLAVALVLVDGLSYTEAAEVMETPVGTLTSRLGRARAALAAELGDGAS